ncbi:MAG: NifB/NifX family molybdenum-iron cluster-binding protein [Thermodesulfobacteriota bacterium]
MKKRIAVPSNSPGGLDGERSDHFGHCELFTLVDIEGGAVAGVSTVGNVAHGAGGCMAPVRMLKEQGVDAIVVAGMGARPLSGFASVGIDVYFAGREAFSKVEDVVAGWLGNQLIRMEPAQACQGHGNCHGHGH